MYNFAALLFLTLSVIGTPTAAADIFGSVAKAPPDEFVRRLQQGEQCFCYPTTYTFKVNLEQTCDNNTIKDKRGANATACSVIGSGTPLWIYLIKITENDPNFQEVKQREFVGPINDRYEFSYTSASAELNPNVPLGDQEDVPNMIMIQLFAKNSKDETVQNLIGVLYDLTNCNDAEPIQVGDEIGWIEVVDESPVVAAFCPAADPPGDSMSNSASFSIALNSKASKGKAAKSGVSKSGKLNHEPVRQ